MIKIKKILTASVIFFLIINSLAFAYSDFSSDFDNEEMKKRKDAFSYENEGFENRYKIYDEGPSYEGYSKEKKFFGRFFEHIGDKIDPREIKQYCNEPNKIADIVIVKLKEKVGTDLNEICREMEDQESQCLKNLEYACSKIGTPFVEEDTTDLGRIQAVAYSCPVNKDAIIEACKIRQKFYGEKRLEDVDKKCKERFDFEGERLINECERFKQSMSCNKEEFIEKCMGGLKKDDLKKDDFQKNECKISDCGPQLGMPNHLCSDGKTTAGPTGRCLLHNNGVCGWEVINCPKVECPPPQCPEDTHLIYGDPRGGTASEGCPNYRCESIKPGEICTQDVKTCLDGSYVSRNPADNCNFYPCQTQCPEPVTPTCRDGQIGNIEKRTDDRGCVYYECIPVIKVTATTSQNAPIGVITTNSIRDITGSTTQNKYDELLNQCEHSWSNQEKKCLNAPTICDKDIFIKKCKENERKHYVDFDLEIEKNCQLQIKAELNHAEKKCQRIEEDRERCNKFGKRRCEHMKGMAEQCKEFIKEESLRNFIIEEAKKRCRFVEIIQDEEEVRKTDKKEIILAVLNTATDEDLGRLKLFVDNLHEDMKLQDTIIYRGTIDPNRFGDIRLFNFVVNAKLSSVVSSEVSKDVKAGIVARQKVKGVAGELMSLRESDVPSEYIYIIEDEADDILNVSDELKEIEIKEGEKGFGYKIRLFLGLAKKSEKKEIIQLENSKEKLSESIEKLKKLVDEIPSDIAKAVLNEQVKELKTQQQEIESLIKSKQKKAKGFLSIFG